jgi:acetyl-CoA carboxylase biotin carboxyl carrier protein
VADTDELKPNNDRPENQDIKQLQDLYDLMQAEGLDHLELEDATTKIRLQRARRHSPQDLHSHRFAAPPPQASFGEARQGRPAPQQTADASESSGDDAGTIKTPLSGVFYRSSSPSSAPYVQEGSVVDLGQTLCIVEAMKVMNEIKAETRCRIVKILAENSRPVTAEQPLFQVEPA